MYNKTIIRFGFCDIQNNQGLGKGYQPQPSASADNPYLDLDYSGYHKNLVFKLEMKVLYLNSRFEMCTFGREFAYSKKAIDGHQKHGLEQQPLICGMSWYDLTRALNVATRHVLSEA